MVKTVPFFMMLAQMVKLFYEKEEVRRFHTR